jgi:hypothetical protein
MRIVYEKNKKNKKCYGWSGKREEFFWKKGLKRSLWRVFDKCCSAAVVWGLVAVIHRIPEGGCSLEQCHAATRAYIHI